jgi:hypothetical protein
VYKLKAYSTNAKWDQEILPNQIPPKNDHNNDHMGFISKTEKTLDVIQIKKHEASY